MYVDKTDIIWQLAHNGKQYNYLSRPRRFGKSVLVDTLQAYFEGRRELFEGLKIMQLEHDWTPRPVIRLDMSCGGANETSIRSYLNMAFKRYEQTYHVDVDSQDSLAVRFDNIILTAYQQTGQQVAILIDEYDAPLQHSWNTPDHEACTAVYREVFAILKADDAMERFVFITGITKFTQFSLFSALNNLSNISFDAPYASICGITHQEMLDNFMPEIEEMAAYNGWTADETVARLKTYYDGYHFCRHNMVDVYTVSLQSQIVYQLSTGQLDAAKNTLRSLIADVPYSNKKLASMDMEERYRLIISTVLQAVGIRVEVERMLATGRIDLVAWMTRTIYVFELKLTKNGGMAAAEAQIRACGYAEPFKGDARKVVGLAVELDDEGKGLIDWKVME